MDLDLSPDDRDFLAGLRAWLRAFFDRVRLPLANFVGGLHQGRAVADATLGQLGRIIGSGTTQVRKNSIAQRGLGLPRGA